LTYFEEYVLGLKKVREVASFPLSPLLGIVFLRIVFDEVLLLV